LLFIILASLFRPDQTESLAPFSWCSGRVDIIVLADEATTPVDEFSQASITEESNYGSSGPSGV
jgi:hypothetical protein